MVNHNENLATKINKLKVKIINKHLNTLYSVYADLKSHHNQNKRQDAELTKLVPIMFVELKIKQE